MITAVRILMVFLGCLHLAGGPHALLQVVAWGAMLANYSAESGIVRGTIDTFSGDRPCGLCKSIAAAKQDSPQTPDSLPAPRVINLKSLHEMLPPRVVALKSCMGADAPAIRHVPPVVRRGNDREAPPLPPPLV